LVEDPRRISSSPDKSRRVREKSNESGDGSGPANNP
jgi:hypothetical protein